MLLNSMWNKQNNSLLLHYLSLHSCVSCLKEPWANWICHSERQSLCMHYLTITLADNVGFHEFCNHDLPSTYHMLMNQQLNEITSQRCYIWYNLLQDFFPNDGELYMVLSAILHPLIYKVTLDHFWDKYAQYKELYALLNLIKVQIPTA